MRHSPGWSGSPTRGGAAFGVVWALAFLAAVVILVWMAFLPFTVASSVAARTGFPTRLDLLAANPFSGDGSGGGLELENPVQFGGGTFALIQSFEFDADPLSVLRDEFVINDLSVSLAEVVLVIDGEGRSNVDALRTGEFTRQAFAVTSPHAVAGFPGLGEGPSSVLVRRFHLRVEKVELVDLSGEEPVRRSAELGFDHTYENVRTWTDLLTPALLQQLAREPEFFNALINSGIIPGLDQNNNPLEQIWDQAGNLLNSLFRKLEETRNP